MRVQIVSRYEEFLQLRDQWNELLEHCLTPMVFLTHQWMDIWLRNFGEGKELFVLLVYDDNGGLIAIAPLMHSNVHSLVDKAHIDVKAKKIEFIANGHGNKCDLILSRKPDEACRAIVDFLLHECKDSWELLYLEYLTSNTPGLDCLKRAFESRNIAFKEYHSMTSPYLPTYSSWNEYFSTLKPRLRNNVRSCWKKLESMGKVRLEIYKDADRLEEALSVVYEVASKSWKASQGTALSSTSQLRAFYKDLAYTAAKEGWLYLSILYIDEKAVVFDFALKYGDRAHGLRTEFDEAYRKYSAGNLLKWKQLQSLFESGCREVDFMGPSTPWKKEWARDYERENMIVCAFNKSFHGRMLDWMIGTKDLVKSMLQKLAPLADTLPFGVSMNKYLKYSENK